MSTVALVPVRWPAPRAVHAFSSTRKGGVSAPPWRGLNLSASTGDREDAVAENVSRLVSAAGLPHAPRWPRQVHGTRVVEAAALDAGEQAADAVYTTRTGQLCAVRTADCLAVLLCDREAACVAAVHAGWRGLAAGVLEAALATLPVPADRLMAWLGPAIGPRAYEVGAEVRDAFLDADRDAAACFSPSPGGRWLADLYALATRRLHAGGVSAVHGGGLCTFADPDRFYSYRRDGITGRMASGIWLAPDA